MNLKPIATAVFCAIGGATLPASAATNVLFIVDSSNSMWGQVDGVAKVSIAKEAFAELLTDIGPDTNIGLMAYGHRVKSDCSDVELLSPIGANQSAAVLEQINALSPRGKTPIAASLLASADAFVDLPGAKNVVLISDGVETCDGDPCSAAATLSAAGVDVRVHVVGFDLSDEEKAELECIAENGMGKYFPADGISGFSEAVGDALEEVEVAQLETANDATPEPEPEPEPEPTRTSVWVDEFDGFDLSENWTVTNPNPDAYIVEADELLVLSSIDNRFRNPEAQNIFSRVDDLPRGDWDIEIAFKGELQTGADMFEAGLYGGPESYLSGQLWTTEGFCSELNLSLVKLSNGAETRFDVPLYKDCGDNSKAYLQETFNAPIASEGALMTLSKRGRSYFASLSINGVTDDDGAPRVWTTEQLTSLRAPGPFALSAAKHNSDYSGEMLFFIDRVEALTVE